MTSQESHEIYSSFEEFMTEDKLPPVFPSSQSSNVSETPAFSQHLISEVCDRDIYGPFGIGPVDDDLPSNFVNSSLAYSPNSLPPRSPSDDSSLCNISSDNSSSFDPSDENPSFIDDLMESTDELSDDIEVVSDVPLLDKDELMQYLDNFPFDGITEDFENFPHNEECQPSITPVYNDTPTILNIKQEAISSNNSSIAPNEEATSSNSSISHNDETSASSRSPVCTKKPASRGRKRKLFSNGGEKKKDQNKEAARRYREKKKQEDARLEAEAEQLIAKQTELRRELAEITRTHSEFVNLFKELLQSKRKKE